MRNASLEESAEFRTRNLASPDHYYPKTRIIRFWETPAFNGLPAEIFSAAAAGLPAALMYSAQVDEDINCRTFLYARYSVDLSSEGLPTMALVTSIRQRWGSWIRSNTTMTYPGLGSDWPRRFVSNTSGRLSESEIRSLALYYSSFEARLVFFGVVGGKRPADGKK
jgi:hypothetical protein